MLARSDAEYSRHCGTPYTGREESRPHQSGSRAQGPTTGCDQSAVQGLAGANRLRSTQSLEGESKNGSDREARACEKVKAFTNNFFLCRSGIFEMRARSSIADGEVCPAYKRARSIWPGHICPVQTHHVLAPEQLLAASAACTMRVFDRPATRCADVLCFTALSYGVVRRKPRGQFRVNQLRIKTERRRVATCLDAPSMCGGSPRRGWVS